MIDSSLGLVAEDSLCAMLKGSRRILVLGPSGVGKTYTSIRLSRYLNLPVIHLDAEFWRPGWIPTAQEVWRIMDGTYESTLHMRIPTADTIILIERSRYYCLAGAFIRYLKNGSRSRIDIPSGQTLEPAFLRYIWSYRKKTGPLIRKMIDEHAVGTPVIYIRKRREIKTLLALLEQNQSHYFS